MFVVFTATPTVLKNLGFSLDPERDGMPFWTDGIDSFVHVQKKIMLGQLRSEGLKTLCSFLFFHRAIEFARTAVHGLPSHTVYIIDI
jgi:hypothetical protein